ncbi:MAG: Glycosyl transferase family 2 [Candidatus Levybacteria bacterium GW2011_GWA1_37_16]|nr:MAG: Glycosyl transferase family 2 [Candidatus Levybacteria bacterium GW2011_GWA1_37_16]KKQ41366.1 MAG: Glycosyl transferase family 2 [Candidatus Levybacteria bacterium GW2011_GWB1_37_8]
MKKYAPVSIVMPMRDNETTVIQTLESIEKQKYPINEVIIVDDGSKDNSNKIIRTFIKKTDLKITLITKEKSEGLGSGLNLGVKKAKSSLVILLHSDCIFTSEMEIKKITDPFRKDAAVLATYPTIELPLHVWNTYGFWEKCLFSRIAGTGYAGPTSKFDCIKRDAYLRVGGFDTVNFSVGGEDMDFAKKISKIGKFVLSKARATHLHYLGNNFTFAELLRKQRQYAMAYGRLLRKRPQLFLGKSIIFLIKPFLAILPFLPWINIVGIPIVFLYALLFTKRMFLTKSNYSNWRILLLPFVNIFLIYCETFWMAESFLFGENKIV